MKPAAVKLLLLASCVVALTSDLSVQGSRLDGRCQCIDSSKSRIPIKRMAKMEVFRKNHHCNKYEVIVTLKTARVVCLDPEAKWVVDLVTCLHKSGGKKPDWRQARKCVREKKKQRQRARAESREFRNRRI